MRLATWNVNSIRARVDRVTDWLERADVDVLAMQETKCADDQFPTMPFAALGYDIVHCGFNQWNGVAIASRVGIDDVAVGFDGQPTWGDKPDVEAVAEARALGATCDGVRVWSLYIPNGRTVDSPHYGYKLKWLAALKDTAQRWLTEDANAQIALTGDWNIAPTDEDVWSPEFYASSTHVTPPERAAFNAVVDGDVVFATRGDVAVGRGAVTAGPDGTRWAGVSAVRVADGRRREGHARALCSALMAWAAERGAHRCYVQVLVDNAPAIALYEQLGFTTQHHARYIDGRSL